MEAVSRSRKDRTTCHKQPSTPKHKLGPRGPHAERPHAQWFVVERDCGSNGALAVKPALGCLSDDVHFREHLKPFDDNVNEALLLHGTSSEDIKRSDPCGGG